MEGKDSVPRNRQRLFGQFDKRITESTKAIKLWVGEVERAQSARKQELKDLLENQSKITSFFSQQARRTLTVQGEGHIVHRYNSSTRDAWAQQDLRRLFLQSKPNVRFRH